MAILLVAIVLGASPVSAQVDDEGDRAALEAQYEKAFDEVFRDPGNLDKSFRFAELAIKIGNYEAAISALERMLLVNPNLPRVRLELGVLYFRLGSYRTARSYLRRVKEAADVPPEVTSSDFSYNAYRELDVTLGYHENFMMPKPLWPVRSAPWIMSLTGGRG
ncbi:MAG: tetratricopeptide repeat protein, partial [Alphaproteobacteria bacterium]|nr:tetratricopeptide repeat protein [Alphaproteobacteria bacterium]